MRFVDDLQVVISPGLNNSDTQHWQNRWQELYLELMRVQQKSRVSRICLTSPITSPESI